MDLLQKAKDIIFKRQFDYLTVFDKNNVSTEAVLTDLARFCRAHESTFLADPRAHAVLEGRREVWLRIAKHLNLSQEELWKVYENKGKL